ncbi:6-hydroxymethylpterin diphosphokinase MptE-like protein [Rheinheimera sp. D18]|uniref:6-hydroxymethylpterin diphosphokinase MptE-like protein n=1 Tax=Rheinheimera sp. D18 TaxID=2545632 RepID=UPI0014051C1E|nr:6-hydroxymethylpterin diphosphokinase MptE-like protein [Rheinheimera sp. D18]
MKSLQAQEIAKKAAQQFQKNMFAFKQHIPNIAIFFENYTEQQFSITITDDGELNLLCKVTGLVLYPIPARQNINKHMKKLELLEQPGSLDKNHKALVISGIGLGYHLKELVDKIQPQFLLIYEPQNDLFKASLYSAPWFKLLTYCNIKQIQVFIQHGDAANNLIEDLNELLTAFPTLRSIYTYRHLANEPLDSQFFELGLLSAHYPATADLHSFLTLPTTSINAKPNIDENVLSKAMLQKNLIFFQKHEPVLHQQLFSLLNEHQSQLKNLLLSYLGTDSLENFLAYSTPSPAEEFENICRDPAVYGLTLSKKNIDTPFLKLVNSVRKEIEKSIFNLENTKLKFSEVFLLGVLDPKACINAVYMTDKLVVIEKNVGRFLISCFTTPWYSITKNKKPLWLIGDNAKIDYIENAYRQLRLNLIDCYIFQPYYTKTHSKLYQQLVEKIQSTNGKNSYFEKYYRSISRVCINTELHHYAVKKSEVAISAPIFIIGNGPSLEKEITALKSIKDKIMIISCGTALTTLYKNGITPDIHVELEKEHDTFISLKQLPPDYLKKITLWATSDILPSIPELFNSCKLHGASLFEAEILMHLKTDFKPLTLNYSFYTVTNFALDIILQRGGNNIYLVGVDYGFSLINMHHASSSGYFDKNGQSLYDYEMVHGAAFETPANLGGNCLTIPAFLIAKELMQKAIQNCSQNTCLFNVGAGAEIIGTRPLVKLDIDYFESQAGINKAKVFNAFEYLSIEPVRKMRSDIVKNSANTLDNLILLWDEGIRQDLNKPLLLLLTTTQRTNINSLLAISDTNYQILDGSVRYFEAILYRYIAINAPRDFYIYLVTYWLNYLKDSRKILILQKI